MIREHRVSKFIGRKKNKKNISYKVSSRKKKRAINYALSEIEELSLFNELINQNLDFGIKFEGKHNILTFNDEYIENLRKFAH